MPRQDQIGEQIQAGSGDSEAFTTMDFFTVPTATFRVLYVFFVVHPLVLVRLLSAICRFRRPRDG